MRFFTFFVLLMLLAFGCTGPSGNSPSGDEEQSRESAVTDTAVIPPPRTFDLEMAETLTAIHFSDLNRDAKYTRYKGLLIAIDTPFYAGTKDTVSFRARVDGRLWETPNGDTITLPYRDTLYFLADWDGKKWSARAQVRKSMTGKTNE